MGFEMRILHVLDMLDENSGITNIIINYYKHTDFSKYKIDFLIPETGKKDKKYVDLISSCGGKIYGFVYPSIKNISAYKKSIRSFFEAHGKDYDIVQCSFFHVSREVFSQAKKAGIPVRIAHSHSSKLSDKWYKGIRNKISLWGAFKNVTDYFAISKDAASGLFGKRRKTDLYIVKNGIDAEKFRFSEENREKIRCELGLTNEFALCHVGNFNAIKNQKFVIEIFKCILSENPLSKLIFVGDAGNMKNEIAECVKKEGLCDSVMFLGKRSDVNMVLQGADAFAFPSLHEGFGLSLLEAQCASLPCVCSDRIPKEAIVSDKCVSLELSQEPRVWAKTLTRLLGSEKRSDKGYFDVSENGFDISSANREICDIYDKLLKKRAQK